jgi:hypothetical protein
MEKELSDGEAWCPWQQDKLQHHIERSQEQEQPAVDIYEQASPCRVKQSKINPSNESNTTSLKAISLYQLISQYLCLSAVRR